jgi:uncharacterized OsmC-like protein
MDSNPIRAALERLEDMLEKDPGKAQGRSAALVARRVEGLGFEVTGAAGERVQTDMPAMMGGAAGAPNPGWLMRASLAACTGTVIAMRAARLGIRLTTLEVKAESDTDQRLILGIDDAARAVPAIRLLVSIAAENATDDELRAIAEWGDTHSPVACSLRKPPLVSMEVQTPG